MAERKFSAVISIGAELGAGFNATFNGLGGKIKEVSASLRGLNDSQKGIAGFAKSLDSVRRAREEMAAQGRQLMDLRKQVGTTQDIKELAELDKRIAAQEVAYNKSRAALTKQTAALDKQRETLRAAGIDTNRLSEETERLGREAATTVAKLTALGKIKGITAELGASMRQLRTDAVAAGVALTAVGFTTWKVVKGFGDMGDEAAETGSALGMTAKELLALRYAGVAVGVEATKMDAALNAFNQRLQEAAEGSETASRAFDELGLDAETLQAMTASQRMAALAEAFKNYRGEVPKTTLAVEMFGSRAYKMANVLELGADGLRKFREEGEKNGFILNDRQLKLTAEFDEAFSRFQGTLIGIRNEIGTALLPVVNRFLTFASENTLLLKAAFAGFAFVVGGAAVIAVAKLGLTAVTTVKQVGALIAAMRTLGALEMAGTAGGLGSLVGMLKNAVPWITGLAGTWLPALATSIKSVGLALTIAFGATPIGWIVAIGAAIVGLGVLIYKFWEPIKTFLGGVWDGFKQGFREAFGELLAELRPIGDALSVVFSPLLWALGKVRDAFAWVLAPFKQTNAEMEKAAGVGRTVGKVLADTILTPLRLITGAIKLVRTGLAALGIGSKPSASEGGESAAPAQATATMTPSVRRPPNVPVAAAAARNQSTATTNNNIVVNAAPGMDERKLADEVMRRIRTAREQDQRAALYDNADVIPAY